MNQLLNHRINGFFLVVILLISTLSSTRPQNADEHLRIIVFMDYQVNESELPDDSKNVILINEILPISTFLFPVKNPSDFTSFSFYLYPIYFNTASGNSIFEYSLLKERMKNIYKDVIDQKPIFENKLKRKFKSFNNQYSKGELFEDKAKIIESVEVLTNFEQLKSSEKVIIIYVSNLMETECTLNQPEKGCFNFYSSDGNTFSKLHINTASESLETPNTPLYNRTNQLREQIEKQSSSTIVYLLLKNISRVKCPEGESFSCLTSFWKKYFNACGFQNVKQVSSIREIFE